MIWIVPIFVATSSVCGAFVVKTSPTTYQAEEDEDITVRWDSPTKADLSLVNIFCDFKSNPLKVFYEMIRGVEVSESPDEQFAGRVRCDKDALRDGQVRLRVSRVTTHDSGEYVCDLTANYDRVKRRWMLDATDMFALNVTLTSFKGDSVKAKPGLDHDEKHTPADPKQEMVRSRDWDKIKTVLGAVNVGVFLFGSALIVFSLMWQSLHQSFDPKATQIKTSSLPADRDDDEEEEGEEEEEEEEGVCHLVVCQTSASRCFTGNSLVT